MAIFGSESVVKLIVGILRAKVIAVLLGPLGVGLSGILSNLSVQASTLSIMGMDASTLRKVAEKKEDKEYLANLRVALILMTLLLGFIGGLILFIFSKPISEALLGASDNDHIISLIGIAVLLNILFRVQSNFLNGLRLIKQQVLVGLLGSILGAVASIIIAYLMGIDGVVYYIISYEASIALLSSYFLYRVRLPKINVKLAFKIGVEFVKSTFSFGLANMSAVLFTGFIFLWLRSVITTNLGGEELGYFQVGWVISSLYIGLVLVTLTKDYYPKLIKFFADGNPVNQIVNDQLFFVMLLAAPMLMFIITFTNEIIPILYSNEFLASVNFVKLMAVAAFLKVVAEVLAMTWMAKSEIRVIYFDTAVFNIVLLVQSIVFINYCGLIGIGIAFLSSYIIKIIYALFLVNRYFTLKLDLRNFFFSGAIFSILLFSTYISIADWSSAFLMNLFLFGLVCVASVIHLFKFRKG